MDDGWESEEVYLDGDAFFRSLIRALRASRESVDLESYIFDRDRLGHSVLAELARAASRGVRVRLLLDGVGCARWSFRNIRRLHARGIEARFYHPLPWQRPRMERLGLRAFRRLVVGVYKLNRRNHRKTCLIDGRIAFVGGMNVSSRHRSADVGARAWRDTSVRVEGRGTAMLTKAFDLAWKHSRGLSVREAMRGHAHPLVRLNSTRRLRVEAHRELVRRISAATHRVWITNPYFVPDRRLLSALRFAAWSGVDVRLLVPSSSDVPGMLWAIRSFYRRLLPAGVRVHEYGKSVLHSKTALVDDWAIVGSSNLNQRSLHHDLEADLVLRDRRSIRALEQGFLADLGSARPVDEASLLKEAGWARGIGSRLVLLFKPWI